MKKTLGSLLSACLELSGFALGVGKQRIEVKLAAPKVKVGLDNYSQVQQSLSRGKKVG